MNKYFIVILIIVLFFSCKEERKIVSRATEYFPIDEIDQELQNYFSIKYFDKANSFSKHTEYDSVKHYLKIAINFENSTILYNALGTNEILNNNPLKAIEYHKKGIELDSNYYPNYINLSRSHLMLNEFKDSEYILNKLLKITKSDYWKANGNLYLALVYFNGYKQCSRALDSLETASVLENDPDIGKQYINFKNHLNSICK
jgi:tetratricopeptide (TPR) repeat protein